MSDTVRSEIDAGVLVLTLDREDARNAIDDATVRDLRTAVAGAAGSGCPPIVLTGHGVLAFSSGSDLKELAAQDEDERLGHTALGQRLAAEIAAYPSVVVAAIEGHCLGGGLEIACACDLRVSAASATFGLPEVRINALPSWGGAFRLAELVGVGRAKELLLFDRRIDAQQALAWGLVAEVVPRARSRRRAVAIASEAGHRSRADAMGIAKAIVEANRGDRAPAEQLDLLGDARQLATRAFASQAARFASPSDQRA